MHEHFDASPEEKLRLIREMFTVKREADGSHSVDFTGWYFDIVELIDGKFVDE